MFKTSQEINFNVINKTSTINTTFLTTSRTNNSLLHKNEHFCISGRYQQTPDTDKYSANNNGITESHRQIFVSPELTNVNKVQLLQFPNGVVRIPTTDSDHFIIKRNGVKGNFEVKLESPSGYQTYAQISRLDQERLQVNLHLNEAGLYKVYVKCNSVLLPKSPFIIVTSMADNIPSPSSFCAKSGQIKVKETAFQSDASKVSCHSRTLEQGVCQRGINEVIVDASKAGDDILFVGICGPQGQCDEVNIKHLGRNIYRVIFQAPEVGEYVLAIKWGDYHVPGSPYQLLLPTDKLA